jgi:hypothetical protein
MPDALLQARHSAQLCATLLNPPGFMHFSRLLPQRNKGHATNSPSRPTNSNPIESPISAQLVIHQGLLDEHLQSLMRFQTINVNSRS